MALPADTVADLDATLDLYHYLQPVNTAEERERFMDAVEDGEPYAPSYEYPGFDHDDVAAALEELEQAAETRLEEQVVAGLRSRHRMITAIGTADITAASREHYGAPSESMFAAAREQFTAPDRDGEATVESRVVRDAFNAVFDHLGVDYTAALGDNDIIRNSPHESRILVPQDKSYTADAAARLLVHESTHAVRTVNGRAAGQPALVYGTAGYEIAEEGLATFNEAAMDVLHVSLPKITARVLAVDRIGDGFHDVYQAMRDLGLDRRAAYIRAYRVKRGIRDTSQPGGFVKDHIYFQGYQKIADRPDLADELYAGKIGFDDVESVAANPVVTRDEHIDACTAVAAERLR
ncbi:MAG: tyrosine/phenylalanine carboxypeptidase domain-containing protein [Candidatus Nanohaloarchaea archaeon]